MVYDDWKSDQLRREAGVPPLRRHKAPEGECAFCDRERAAGNDFHPSHDASPNCESGQRSHCTCNTCF